MHHARVPGARGTKWHAREARPGSSAQVMLSMADLRWSASRAMGFFIDYQGVRRRQVTVLWCSSSLLTARGPSASRVRQRGLLSSSVVKCLWAQTRARQGHFAEPVVILALAGGV